MTVSFRAHPALRSLALALALCAPAWATAAPPEGFDAQVEELRQAIGVPGLAIAVVEDGEVTLAKGYGVRRLGSSARVDADTIFPNGSTGKAFTSAALAILVDEGKIGWDDKVIDHMPWFAMYDPWVTREITVRDLLVHRSGLGLGQGDLLFVPRTNLTRRESVKRLRYMKPATSFRSGYAYDNVLYMVAGQLIEEVTGQTWEKFVAERVLRAGGMLDATSEDTKRFTIADRAYPHARLDGAIRGLGTQEVLDERDALGRTAAPAGGLAVSANDMAHWLQIQLASGKLPGSDKRLFSETQAAEMWKPVVIVPSGKLPGAMAPASPMINTYALGWNVGDYRGAKLVSHGGAVFGFQSVVAMLPDKDIGFAILINSEDGELIRGLMHELLDHYLSAPDQDWPALWRAFKAERQAAAIAALGAQTATPSKVGPSLPLARYAGNFTDPWYGGIAIRDEGGKLRIDFQQTPRMTGTLEHFQYDSFRVAWDDKTIEPAYATFALDAQGQVERITMRAVSPAADFSWDYHDLLFTPARPAR